MSDWTKATLSRSDAPTASTAGVLRPDEFARHVQLERRPAGDAVGRWVENHWALRWDLPEGRSFPSQVLPHPTCSLTVELGSHPRDEMPPGHRLVVTGVVTRRFEVQVRGWGRVLGVRFRPGGLSALCDRPAAPWTDHVLPATELLPAELCAALADPDLVTDPERWQDVAERGLSELGGPDDPRYGQVLEVIGDMLCDRSLLTVSEVARRHGTTPRTLQRLFTRYVGVGPKWVLARYRMHDVVTELDAGYDGTLTDLAHRYGWFDQAHFTRDFTDLVGVAPGRYRDGSDAPG